MIQNDFFIRSIEAPKNSQYPVLQGIFNKSKKGGKNPLMIALKFVDTAKAKAENLAYLKAKNVELPKEVNSIQVAILSHAERVKDLMGRIPQYKAEKPELFNNKSDIELSRMIVSAENQIEQHDTPKDLQHWQMLRPQTMVANEVIFDTFLEPVNAVDLLTPEAMELIKSKSEDLADKFENFDWSAIAQKGLGISANLGSAASGGMLTPDQVGKGLEFSPGFFAAGKVADAGKLSSKNDNTKYIEFSRYTIGDKKGQMPQYSQTNPQWYTSVYKKQFDDLGLNVNAVETAFIELAKMGRLLDLENPEINRTVNGSTYWNKLVNYYNQLKPKNTGVPSGRDLPKENPAIMPKNAGGISLPELGGIKWSGDGISWGATNNKAIMVYALIGAAVLVALVFLLRKK